MSILIPTSSLYAKKTLAPLGVQRKPQSCFLLCPYASIGSSFVQDWSGPDPQVAFMLPYPTGDDAVNRQPMSGRGGESFVKRYLTPLNKTKDNCIFTCVTRCRPKGNGEKKARWGTPITGTFKKSIEQACRTYDSEVLAKWNPDLILLTFELNTVYGELAFTRLLQRDIEKAFMFAEKGYRPLVLMGNAAGEMFMPFINGTGAAKNWRGHWQELESYPFTPGSVMVQKSSGFVPLGWGR